MKVVNVSVFQYASAYKNNLSLRQLSLVDITLYTRVDNNCRKLAMMAMNNIHNAETLEYQCHSEACSLDNILRSNRGYIESRYDLGILCIKTRCNK